MVVLFDNESGTAEDFIAFVSLIKRDKGFSFCLVAVEDFRRKFEIESTRYKMRNSGQY